MTISISTIKVGDKVCYCPTHYHESGRFENGIIKEIPDHTDKAVRVVYHCGGDWDNYENYTSALTDIRDLLPGWKHCPEES